jgi:hypothetical protein
MKGDGPRWPAARAAGRADVGTRGWIMDPGTVGLIGGVVGGVLGVLGGAIGTYCGIRNTRGPRERAFVIRCSAACVLGVSTFLGLLWLTPFPYRAFLWLPYMFLLPLAARAWNREQERVRREEADDPLPPVAPADHP